MAILTLRVKLQTKKIQKAVIYRWPHDTYLRRFLLPPHGSRQCTVKVVMAEIGALPGIVQETLSSTRLVFPLSLCPPSPLPCPPHKPRSRLSHPHQQPTSPPPRQHFLCILINPDGELLTPLMEEMRPSTGGEGNSILHSVAVPYKFLTRKIMLYLQFERPPNKFHPIR